MKRLKWYFLVIIGDFNAPSKSYCLDEITTNDGSKTDSPSTTHGLHKLIYQPAHLILTFFTCIDLIFTDQPNLVSNSGVHSFLHKNCHHQINFCKLNLRIKNTPPYMSV